MNARFRLKLSTMKEPFINAEERIDKIVGRRSRTPDASGAVCSYSLWLWSYIVP